jgi:hypothetical protein
MKHLQVQVEKKDVYDFYAPACFCSFLETGTTFHLLTLAFFFGGVGLGFELSASCLQSRHSA